MKLRPYQEGAVQSLWDWFGRHASGNPLVVAAVGAGKSLLIAAIAQRMHREAPGSRVLVLVHQQELLGQNLDKLTRIAPEISAGVYSAAFGRKDTGCQVTFATIGSVWKLAHKIGRIDMVMCDEAHLVNPKEEGMWRAFLADLAKYCPGARAVGFTGTDFRGNGVFLTAGKAALFTHCAAKITMKELLALEFLAPLTPALTENRVVAADLPTSGDDFQVTALAAATDRPELVESTAAEIVTLAAGRRRWLVFAVTVEHAGHVAEALRQRSIAAEVVSAKTPAAERADLIARFRDGRIKCLVNVAVLTTGFDVPEVDFIALLRATKSPVLYVQIAGRGMRLADGKTDCMFADFTDTVLRLGPVDEVKGRPPRATGGGSAPERICPSCGSTNLAAARECFDCGFPFPAPEMIKHKSYANGAPLLASQAQPEKEFELSRVTYALHMKDLMPDSMRVEYWVGMKVIAKEWVCFDHAGYARLKAEKWWRMRAKFDGIPRTTEEAITAAQQGAISEPSAITIDTRQKHPQVLAYDWNPRKEAQAA